MKICPICEKRIESRWCRNCFRFVDPWILPDDVYINERHGDHENGHCEYHDPHIDYDKQEYMKPGYEKRIYGGEKKPAVKLHMTGKVKNKQKSSKKTATIFSVVIIAIYIISGTAPALSSFISEVSDLFRDDSAEFSYEIRETASAMEEEASLHDYGFLDGMVPVSSEMSGQYISEVYKTEDICAGGVDCSREHMEYYLDEYISILNEISENNSAISADFEKIPGECNNYVLRTEDGQVEDTYWEDTYNSQTDFGGITLSVDAATLRLHDVYIYSMSESDDFVKAAYDIINSFDDSIFASVDDFKKEIDDIRKDTGYGFLFEGDYEYSIYTTQDGYMSLSIIPY